MDLAQAPDVSLPTYEDLLFLSEMDDYYQIFTHHIGDFDIIVTQDLIVRVVQTELDLEIRMFSATKRWVTHTEEAIRNPWKFLLAHFDTDEQRYFRTCLSKNFTDTVSQMTEALLQPHFLHRNPGIDRITQKALGMVHAEGKRQNIQTADLLKNIEAARAIQ